LLVTANVAPSSPILVTLMMEAISSSEIVLTRVTGCNIPEDAIRQGHITMKHVRIPETSGTGSTSEHMATSTVDIDDDRDDIKRYILVTQPGQCYRPVHPQRR
jgi:hypothetical protein